MPNIKTDPKRLIFGGSSFPTASARDRAMCVEYLTAGGLNSTSTVCEILGSMTPGRLAADMLNDWPDEYLTIDAAAGIFSELAADRSSIGI